MGSEPVPGGLALYETVASDSPLLVGMDFLSLQEELVQGSCL